MRNEVYVPVGAGESVAAFGLTEGAFNQATTYQAKLKELNTSGWEAQLTHTLQPLTEVDERKTPTVFLEVTPEGFGLYERSYEGPSQIRLYNGSITEEGVFFADMLLYYVFEDGTRDISEAAVQAALQSEQAVQAWDRAIAAARTDGQRFPDS